jgi:hypothetical protein
MIICPMCEHPQAQGDDCENCGMKLVAAWEMEVPVVAVPGLELTQLEGGNAPAAVQALPELELTRMGEVQVAVESVAELEPTARSVGQVAVEAVAELDTGRAADDGVRTAAPEAVVCKFCRNVQATGMFCDRCGMRLPRARVEPLKPKAARLAAETGEWIRCSKCHTPARLGIACITCGTVNRSET